MKKKLIKNIKIQFVIKVSFTMLCYATFEQKNNTAVNSEK